MAGRFDIDSIISLIYVYSLGLTLVLNLVLLLVLNLVPAMVLKVVLKLVLLLRYKALKINDNTHWKSKRWLWKVHDSRKSLLRARV